LFGVFFIITGANTIIFSALFLIFGANAIIFGTSLFGDYFIIFGAYFISFDAFFDMIAKGAVQFGGSLGKAGKNGCHENSDPETSDPSKLKTQLLSPELLYGHNGARWLSSPVYAVASIKQRKRNI